jgi:hypothetical protein
VFIADIDALAFPLCLPRSTLPLIVYLHLNSTRAGLGFIFVAFACLAGSPVAGAILRSNGQGDNYLGVCLFGGCSTLVGTGLLTLARARMVKRKGTWKV